MKPGTKPTPLALKLLKGNPGKRALPKPRKRKAKPSKVPKCPAHLSARAKEVWVKIAPELAALELLTPLSAGALAGYCDAYARWLDATDKIGETGEVVKAPSGYPVQNPWRAIANKAFDQWTRLAAEFGMTPSAGSRVGGSGAGDTEDAADEFFDADEKRRA